MSASGGDPGSAPSCSRCGRPLTRTRYEVRATAGTVLRCLRCTLLYRPLVARSAVIALVVGTLLTAINQGNLIVQGDFPVALAWKVPLTFAVPYCVATLGAVLNARSVPVDRGARVSR